MDLQQATETAQIIVSGEFMPVRIEMEELFFNSGDYHMIITPICMIEQAFFEHLIRITRESDLLFYMDERGIIIHD